MLTITLTGQDALDYIKHQEQEKVSTTTAKLDPKTITPFDEPVSESSAQQENPEILTIDDTWKEHLRTSRPKPSERHYTKIDEEEKQVIHNAAGKKDRRYYSIEAIARGTGRTHQAVRNLANRLGYAVRKGLILQKAQ